MKPIMKPILFNTEMVRANQRGDKTETRRVCHIKVNKGEEVSHRKCISEEYPKRNVYGICANFYDNHGFYCGAAKPKYLPGDILYVRETWARIGYDVDPIWFEEPGQLYNGQIIYRATWPDDFQECRWHPSIHMPREAARIFLRVTDVRVERLQDITPDKIRAEGLQFDKEYPVQSWRQFIDLWDSTVKPADSAIYGWAANPWVWVYKYEQISRVEAEA